MRGHLQLAVLTLAVAGAVFTGDVWAQGADQKPELPSQEAIRIFAGCLPEGVRLNEVVSKTVTVGETLARLKSRCKNSKLVDGVGREVRFYRLIGCWGNPPDDYREQQARQSQELQRLKKTYTVVEIPCALIDPRPIR